jgi:hypothetical protein
MCVYKVLPTKEYTIILITEYTAVTLMVGEARTKIAKVGSRHTIYLEKALVEDSQFPFRPNQPLMVKIDKNRLVIEKM